MLIACADPIRYGQLQKQIQPQFSLGQNQYADSMEKATNILSDTKIDAKFYEIQRRKESKRKPREKKSRPN